MTSTTTPWRLLRERRDLRLLLGAGLVSMTGDWLLGIGVSYSVYALTGSTFASALALLAGFVPQVLAGLFAGVLVDRWDRKRTMVVSNVVLALGLAPLLLADVGHRIWVVYPVLVLEAVVEVFFAPAEQAMLPRVVDESDAGELMVANALNGQVRQLARLVGAAVGGVVAAAGGIPAVAIADAGTFALATLLLLGIRTPGRPERPAEDAEAVVLGRVGQLRAEWVEGFHVTWRSPVLRVLLTFWLITSLGEGIFGTLFTPFVRSVLHGGAEAVGLVSGIQAVGGVVGGVVVAQYGARWSPRRMLGVGAVVFGVVDFLIAVYPVALVAIWPMVVLMVVVGLPGALVGAAWTTVFQTHTEDAQRGRVFSLLLLGRSCATVVGSLAAGVLGGTVGIIPVFAVQGVGYVVAGSMVLVALTRSAPEPAPLHA